MNDDYRYDEWREAPDWTGPDADEDETDTEDEIDRWWLPYLSPANGGTKK